MGTAVETPAFWGTGRRKNAIARVRLLPGTGNVTINGHTLEEYFPTKSLQLLVQQPLAVTETLGRYDIFVNVIGGGTSGQAGAVRHGLARVLQKADTTLRPVLKQGGFLTRDPRAKERRKYGLKKARKRPQFSKR